MNCHFNFNYSQFNYPHQGTILIVTLFFIVLLTLEVSMVSFVMQRSVGEKAVATTSYSTAKDATGVAMQRLKNDLYAYIRTNGTDTIAADFAKGGANAIDNEDLLAYNAEASADQDTGVDISAWVKEKRGYWYHIVVRAKFGETELLAEDWVKFNDLCMASQYDSSLTTIITGLTYPGVRSMVATSEGRLFFGQNANPGNFYTWKNGVLSTLVSNRSKPGYESTALTDSGRIFFGEEGSGSNYYTWSESTGLSTIVTGRTNPGYNATRIYNEMLYFGEDNTSSNIYRWNNGALTTMASGIHAPGSDNGIEVDTNGRAFFGHQNGSSSNYYTWGETTGLSTIMTSVANPGRWSSSARNDVVVFFELAASNMKTWVWSGNVLTTLPHLSHGWNGIFAGVDPTGRVFTATNNNSPDYVYTWSKSTGLSTILSSDRTRPGNSFADGTFWASDGRVYFGTNHGGSGRFFTWKSDTGLTTIMAGHDPGNDNTWVSSSGRAYWGETNTCCGPNHMYTYTIDTGLSTLITISGTAVGMLQSAMTDDERIYFGGELHANYYTWHEDTGLSTVLTGATKPGYDNVRENRTSDNPVTDNTNSVYFSENANPGKVWKYTPAGQSGGCPY